jgi:hypothetical protein
MTASAKVGLLMEPAWNKVVGVTASGAPASRNPKPRVHSTSKSLMTATLTPGVR